MEEPLTLREFLHRFTLPQLVRIHDAHRHSLDPNSTISKCSTLNRVRSSVDSMQSSSSSTGLSLSIDLYNASNDSGNSTDTYPKKNCKSQPQLNNQPPTLDLDQPFLLYKAYTSRHVVAHALSTDGTFDPDCFKPAGPPLMIPDSYPGWFSLVNRKGHTAGYFNTIEEVGRAQVPCFMSRDPIRAFKAPKFAVIAETPDHRMSLITAHNPMATVSNGKGRGNYESLTIEGGSLFRFLGLYEDISSFVAGSNKRKANSMRYKKPLPIGEHGPRYAKCISFASHPCGEIVFVPVTETGRFYVVAKRCNEASFNHIYSFTSLLRLVKLPVTVQLVVGPRPRSSPFFNNSDRFGCFEDTFDQRAIIGNNFSAVLRLEQVQVRDVILGCTLTSQPVPIAQQICEKNLKNFSIRRTWRSRGQNKTEDRPVLLEFDLESGFTIYRTFVEKNGTLSSKKIPELVVQRIAFCEKEADIWRCQIKLAHDIVTEESSKCSLQPVQSSKTSLKNRVQNCKSERSSQDTLQRLSEGKLDKNASIGSRSSNVSNVSRLSKILQRFWPRSGRNTIVGRIKSTDGETENSLDFEDIEEDLNEEEDEGFNSGSHNNVPEYHFYETLKPGEGKLGVVPVIKQRLSRKRTLDVILKDFDSEKPSSERESPTPSPSSIEEPAYSTIE